MSRVTSQHRDPRKHSGEVPGITPVAAGLSEQLSVEIQLSVVAEYMCKGTLGSAYSLPSDGASGGNDTKVNDSQDYLISIKKVKSVFGLPQLWPEEGTISPRQPLL